LTRSYFPGHRVMSQRTINVRLGLAAASAVVIGIGFLPVLQLYLRFQKLVTDIGFLGGRSTLVLNLQTLRTIFGYDIGLGADMSVYVIGGLSVLGVLYAIMRFPRGAMLCLLWIGLPIGLAVMRGSGGGLISSTRYLQFVTPAYLLFIDSGAIALSARITRLIR